jgi:hypothetical protein
MNVQFITNSKGLPSGVYIPIEDWELIKKELDGKLEIPGWHKDILENRLATYQAGNPTILDAETALKEIEAGL